MQEQKTSSIWLLWRQQITEPIQNLSIITATILYLYQPHMKGCSDSERRVIHLFAG